MAKWENLGGLAGSWVIPKNPSIPFLFQNVTSSLSLGLPGFIIRKKWKLLWSQKFQPDFQMTISLTHAQTRKHTHTHTHTHTTVELPELEQLCFMDRTLHPVRTKFHGTFEQKRHSVPTNICNVIVNLSFSLFATKQLFGVFVYIISEQFDILKSRVNIWRCTRLVMSQLHGLRTLMLE